MHTVFIGSKFKAHKSRVKNTNGLINFNVRLEAEKETLETRSTIPAPPVFPTESKRISL